MDAGRDQDEAEVLAVGETLDCVRDVLPGFLQRVGVRALRVTAGSP